MTALGSAGRARRVDQIRGVLRVREPARVRLDLRADAAPVCVEKQLLTTLRNARRELLLRQDEGRVQVVEQKGQSLLRIVGIQRHISATSLDDSEERNDHLHRSLEADCDKSLWTNALRTEVVRELVRARGSAPDTRACPFKRDRRRRRRAGGLLLDEFEEAPVGRIRHVGLIPVDRLRLQLGGRLHQKHAWQLARIARRCSRAAFRNGPATDRSWTRRRDPCCSRTRRTDRFGPFDEVEEQIEVKRALRVALAGEIEPIEVDLRLASRSTLKITSTSGGRLGTARRLSGAERMPPIVPADDRSASSTLFLTASEVLAGSSRPGSAASGSAADSGSARPGRSARSSLALPRPARRRDPTGRSGGTAASCTPPSAATTMRRPLLRGDALERLSWTVGRSVRFDGRRPCRADRRARPIGGKIQRRRNIGELLAASRPSTLTASGVSAVLATAYSLKGIGSSSSGCRPCLRR